MNIIEASKFFRNLITETDDTSEIKIYNKILRILSQLESRDLSEEQLETIEEKLSAFGVDVSRESRKKYFKKTLKEFSDFIKKELSLISDKYYMTLGMSIGMCLGMSLGMTFGVVFGFESNVSKGLIYGMTFGMQIGLAIGLAIGAAMDNKAKKEGKVLSLKYD
ncbi:hypothetical protein ACWGOQ_0013270 [Aquimarina sp. M1]